MENPASLFGIPHLVSWIVLTPLIGLVIVGLLPVRAGGRPGEAVRWVTLGVTLLTLGLAVGCGRALTTRPAGRNSWTAWSGYRPLPLNTRWVWTVLACRWSCSPCFSSPCVSWAPGAASRRT